MNDRIEPSASSGQDDHVIAELKDGFFCALISDVLDELGHTRLALPPHIRPLDEQLKTRLAGQRTMLYADVYARPGPEENHYALEIQLVDSLRPGDVAVGCLRHDGKDCALGAGC